MQRGRGLLSGCLQSTLQCSTWNFFFLRYCLWLAADQRLFSFPSARPKKPARTVQRGRGLLSGCLQSTLQCSTWNFFHRSCLWPFAGQRLFFCLRLSQSNQPGSSGGEMIFCPITPPKPIQMFHMEHFSPFKMPKSRVLCALLVSIPLQVCYNNRRSPFSG